MKNYKLLKKEIDEKLNKLKEEREQLSVNQQQINTRLGQIAVEVLRLEGEGRMLERIKKQPTETIPSGKKK
ncbi:MAG: hypothetical protein V3V81_08145 [Candidatus Bathyarchaeia archaeon]